MPTTLESKFLDAVNSIEKLTPQDVTRINNDQYKDVVQYRLNIDNNTFHILIKENGNKIVALGNGEETCTIGKNSNLLYEELKKKAREWYFNAKLSNYIVTYKNQECRVYLDLFSFIQPFVLKSVKDGYTTNIGLDFLTIFSLIKSTGETK